MPNIDSIENKIKIQEHGYKISNELKKEITDKGYYPVALTWIDDEITGPFSFQEYGDSSPYELKKYNGGYALFEGDKFFTKVDFYKKPKFFDHQWAPTVEDETKGTIFVEEGLSGVISCDSSVLQKEMQEDSLGVLQYTGGKYPYVTLACYNGLVIWPNHTCLYLQQKKPCTFCCLPGNHEIYKTHTNTEEWYKNMAIAFESAVKEIGDEINKFSLTIDAGTYPGKDKSADVYIKILEAIKERIGDLPDLLYVRAVLEPPHDDKWLYRLRDAGFDSIQMDIDVYNEDLRKRIMPNAKGHRPIEDYIHAFEIAKKIFPKELATQSIVGIQPDESLLEGVERFAGIGVATIVTPFLPFGQGRKLQKLEGVRPPTAERMKTIYARAAKILNKYDVQPPEFRGGVSALSETMGKTRKIADCLKNKVEIAVV